MPAVQGVALTDRQATLAEFGDSLPTSNNRKALTAWGLGAHADLVELVVSELVSNAIRHGEGPISVRICCYGVNLRVEVHDDGAGRPVRRPVTTDAESGRGLDLVDGLLGPGGGRPCSLTCLSEAPGRSP